MENNKEMPIGLAFQLAMNEGAMEHFSSMSQSQKQQVVEEARNVDTKEEIREIVDRI